MSLSYSEQQFSSANYFDVFAIPTFTFKSLNFITFNPLIESFSKCFVYVLRISFDLPAVSAQKTSRAEKENVENFWKVALSSMKAKDDEKSWKSWTKQSKLKNLTKKFAAEGNRQSRWPSDGMRSLKTPSDFNFICNLLLPFYLDFRQ